MANITRVLSSILVESHAADPIPESYHSVQALDTFLHEAYRINSHITSLVSYLRHIRQPYLSTAPPPHYRPHAVSAQQTYLTDLQRSEIDSSTSRLLRDLSANISSLSTAENLRASTESAILERRYGRPNNALWRWAAGDGTDKPLPSEQQRNDEGQARTTQTVRESVIWYLSTGLARAAERQREMVEVRVEREREKEKSVLWKMGTNADAVLRSSIDDGDHRARGMNGTAAHASHHQGDFPSSSHFNPALERSAAEASGAAAIESQLSPEQLQLFQSENSTLLNHYTDTLSKVTQAEKSVLEIASLQQTLMGHLSTQNEMIEQLVTDASNTDENVRRGNQQLKKASERGSTAKMVFWGTVCLCGFLVGWDLVF